MDTSSTLNEEFLNQQPPELAALLRKYQSVFDTPPTAHNLPTRPDIDQQINLKPNSQLES